MKTIYTKLAAIYEAMYQTFIDYNAEYQFYNSLIQEQHKKNVLEIGSGTGHLAAYFSQANFEYQGLDFSSDMIAIAQAKNPAVQFIAGDMRNFELSQKVESVIITGRTISYLLTNADINAAFQAIHKNLVPKGILAFDFIDASLFIPMIAKGKKITHQADYQDKTYYRDSFWSLNLTHGMDFKWLSIYYEKKETKEIKIGEAEEIVRTFTLEEVKIFLKINGFRLLKIIERETYAFPTFVVVAERE